MKANRVFAERTSPTGVRPVYSYDSPGRQISALSCGSGSVSRSVGAFTHYDALGQVDWTGGAVSNRAEYAYDAVGRRNAVTDALSHTTHTAYDAEGRALATWGTTYPVAHTYDDLARMTAMYTYRGATMLSSYSHTTKHFDAETDLYYYGQRCCT